MINIIKPPQYPNFKLQTKSTGLSTKNYLALNFRQKKYVKTKQCQTKKQETMELYILNNILKSVLITENKTNILNIQKIKIQSYAQHQKITYYIQRPFFQQSLKSIYESSFKISKQETPMLIPQLLHLFTDNAASIMPLIAPNNILVNAAWNKNKILALNYTSLASYQLLIAQESILIGKFKEIYCYIHPQSFDYQRKIPNISFKTQLYAFSLNLFSLLFNKQVYLPLRANRDQVTFNIQEAQPYLRQSFNSLQQSFKSPIIQDQIKQKDKIYNRQFSKFFNQVFFHHEQSAIKNWVQVFGYFQPQYFDYILTKTSNRTFKAIKELYDIQDEQNKQHYQKMGIISKSCNVEGHKKELIFFYLSKYHKFNEIKFKQNYNGQEYHPKLYISFKKIEQDVERIKAQRAIQTTEQDEKYLDFRQEMKESMNYNITSFEVNQLQQLSQDSQNLVNQKSERTIWVSNDYQQSLAAFESSLWL